MKLRSLAAIVSAAAASLLVTSTALADDQVRVRGGVGVAGGAFIAPRRDVALVTAGVQGELGVQFNDLIGLSWVPQIDLGLGDGLGGANFSNAVMVEFSPIDFITLGVGPDIGFFATVDNGGTRAGANYGARFRFDVHPLIIEGRHGRRHALTLGADLRVLDGDQLLGGRNDLLLQPMLTLGYTAF